MLRNGVLLLFTILPISGYCFDLSNVTVEPGLRAGFVSYQHSDNATRSQFAVALGVGNYLPISRQAKVGLESTFTHSTHDGQNGTLAETATFFDFALVGLKSFPISRQLKIWVGGGLSAGYGRYTNRFTLTPDGYLDQAYEDSSWSVDSGFRIQSDIQYSDSQNLPFDFGISSVYRQSFGEGQKSFSVGLKVKL